MIYRNTNTNTEYNYSMRHDNGGPDVLYYESKNNIRARGECKQCSIFKFLMTQYPEWRMMNDSKALSTVQLIVLQNIHQID